MKLQQSVLCATLFASSLVLTGTAAAQSQQNQTQQHRHSAYNYASVGVADHDGGDSIVVEGSYEFKSPYFVSGYYRNFDNDAGSSADSLSAKLGRYFWLNSGLTADVGVRVGRVDFGPVDSNFWGVEANLRQRVDQFEFYGGLGWVDYTDAGSDNQYQFGVNYYIDSNLSVGVGYQDSEYRDGVRFRGSYHF
ncbi:hypothetical protein [Pseudidiomarina gelatinasegens]|uniref:hypothetical protein n=1 Tax=Pseudidiomarina gelatinasegens TaxID=2487740 RepID=UPI003A9810EF